MARESEMNCERVQELLARQLVQPLPEAEAGEVRRHLARCPVCRAVARMLPEVDDVLDEWVIAEAPVDLPLRVMARVAKERRPRSISLGWRTWIERVVASAVVIAGLMLGFLLGSQLEQVSGTRQQAVATVTQELEVFNDPQSGSLTEAFEAVTLASTGR